MCKLYQSAKVFGSLHTEQSALSTGFHKDFSNPEGRQLGLIHNVCHKLRFAYVRDQIRQRIGSKGSR